MSLLLLATGYISIIAWAIGLFLLQMRGLVHILLLLAVIGFIARLLYNKARLY